MTRSRITAATPSMSRRHSPRASPTSVRANVSMLGSTGIGSPPVLDTLVLPAHLVVVETARFRYDDGEEVDGALKLPDRRLQPREYVPCNDSGEARVDEPLVVLHDLDPSQ